MVIDGHPYMAAQRVRAKRCNQREPGKQPLRNAPIVGIRLTVTAAEQAQAERRLLDFKLHIAVGLDVIQRFDALVHGIRIDFKTVHVRYVCRINAAFHGLQPVAVLQALGDENMIRRQGAPFQLRRCGLLVRGSHVGPHDAATLHAWIALDVHARA